MTKEVKKILGIALDAYPGDTFAGMDESQAATMGDTLGLFVFREISQIDVDEDVLDEAIKRMETAAKDIEAVLGILVQTRIENRGKSP